MAFTASDVKELREKTGCGMMDCKKALSQTDGDMAKAVDYLREKGLAAAAKKSGRIAAEGIAFAKTNEDNSIGAIIEINSETDFVAKNSEFLNFVKTCTQTVVDKNPKDLDELKGCKLANGANIGDLLTEKISTIGENIKIRRFKRFSGFVVTYIHMNGRIAVMVNANVKEGSAQDKNTVKNALKDVCMQIAAVSPSYLSKEAVPAEVLEKEKKILKEQGVGKGKPENIAAKIIEGKLNKFYKENCLLEQPFVKDGSMSVGQYIKDVGNKVGSNIEILEFVRYEKGEGIEKNQTDFASEVASMVK
jgi:elongation factor Ts